MKKPTYLWCGTFNYSREVIIIYTNAPTWASAKNRLLRRLAIDHGVNYQYVYGMFDGSKQNYTIEKEINDKT